MTEVFVSYKKSDKDRVRPLVEHLHAAGLDVWWDEGVQPSMSWRGEIARQLQAAPTRFAAPRIKLHKVRMENVRLQVGAQAAAEDDAPRSGSGWPPNGPNFPCPLWSRAPSA